MSARSTIRTRRREAGIALLISIFILLLISVVAIALIVASGTESSLAGNYRSATGVYYAALAGLEEARGRLSAKNANSFTNTASPGFLPSPLLIGSARYVLNPGPADGNVLATYPDNEYSTEFAAAPSDTKTTASIWTSSPLNSSLNLPAPLYKWVRINAVSEVSMGRQVAPYDGHGADPAKPIFYDGTQLNVSNSGAQVLEITALAVLPKGSQNSQKLLQYLVAPTPITLPPFPAALTLAGNAVSASATVGYSAPASNGGFSIMGNDQDCSGNPTGSTVPAVGVLNSADTPVVVSGGTVNGVHFTGIPASYQASYTGTATPPSVKTVNSYFSATMESPAGLDAVAQTIIQNADATVPTTTGSAERTFLSNLVSSGAMSSTSPLTVIVNGDLDLTGWNHTGYGLLLVTGNLTYDPDASWSGIVMVVGQGTVIGWKGGSGEFDGAMFVARTRDTSGVLLGGSNLGYSFVDFNHGGSMGGSGIRYSNCWIQKSQPLSGNNVLSFHEIAQ
jgi:Tfp pilus assembly protein PilX